MRRGFAIAFALLCGSAVPAEIHGESDVFSTQGVSLAWAVSRGADEANTFIVVRVATDPVIRAVTVKGRDPFTNAEKTWADARATTGRLDIRIPRAGFADYPRTEWIFGNGLTVYFLGVPDTTPEFTDEAKLAAYLDKRIAR